MIDRAHIDRLIAEYASPFMPHRPGRDEETLAALRGLVEELDHATANDGDHLSKASWRMCEIALGDRDALRVKVRELETEMEATRPVVEAAEDMRAGHEGCVVDPPCGRCFRCEFDLAVDDYRAWKERK